MVVHANKRRLVKQKYLEVTFTSNEPTSSYDNVAACVSCARTCARLDVCASVSDGERERARQRVSMCVRVKYRWRRPVCVRVSEVQCNCRQSQPYLPVKNTIIPHSPSQAISPVSSSLALFLSLTLSLSLSDSNYNLEGYFSPGQKHSPQALPLLSDSPFSSPRRFLPFPLFFFPPLSPVPFPLLRVWEWKWTSCKHTPLITVYAVVYLFWREPAEVEGCGIWGQRFGLQYQTERRGIKMHCRLKGSLISAQWRASLALSALLYCVRGPAVLKGCCCQYSILFLLQWIPQKRPPTISEEELSA